MVRMVFDGPVGSAAVVFCWKWVTTGRQLACHKVYVQHVMGTILLMLQKSQTTTTVWMFKKTL